MSAAKNYPNQILNLNTNSINDIFNSDYFIDVRKQMLAGEKPEACLRCYREEEVTGKSKRTEELKKFVFPKQVTMSPSFKFVELRLGNLCNLKCRTCNPFSSSQWIADYKKLQNDLPFVTKFNDSVDYSWINSDKFWNELLQYSTNLELIYINGGEPTLVKKHWTYLKRLIENNLNDRVTLWYNINMTNVPDELIDIWKNFKNVIVHCSIDDIEDRNSYLREGTDWNTVLKNVDKLLKNNWIELNITQTVSWLNVFYVREFRDFFLSKGINSHINLVYDPSFLSPMIIPEYAKKHLTDKLKQTDDFNNLVSLLQSGSDSKLFEQGVRYNKWLDKNRLNSFNDHFKEWATILSY